nr:hypothetical protein [Streptomyces kasugaensis]
MCPESSVWATKARLEQTRGTEAANRCGGPDDCARPADPAARRRARARARPGRRRLGRTRPSRGRWSGRQPCLCRARRPPGRRAGPDRSGPHTAPPPDRGDRESQRPGREAPPGARCCPVGR